MHSCCLRWSCLVICALSLSIDAYYKACCLIPLARNARNAPNALSLLNDQVPFDLDAEDKDPQQIWQIWKQKSTAEESLKYSIRSGKTDAEVGALFREHAQTMSCEKQEILRMNELFFHAQSKGDLSTMLSLWARSAETSYTTNIFVKGHHEGVNVIGGFQNISAYLAKHTPSLREYTLRDVRLLFYGRVAVVTSTVDTHVAQPVAAFRATHSSTSKPGTAGKRRSAATATNYVMNVFERDIGNEGRHVLRSHTASVHPRTPSELHKGVPAQLRSTYRDPTRPSKQQHLRSRRGAGLSLDFGDLGRFLSRGRGDFGAGDSDDGDEEESEEEADLAAEGYEDDQKGEGEGEETDVSNEEEGENNEVVRGSAALSAQERRALESARQLLRRMGAQPQQQEGEEGPAGDGPGLGALFGQQSTSRGFGAGDRSRQNSRELPEELRQHQERMQRLRDAILRTLHSLSGQAGLMDRKGGGLLVISSPSALSGGVGGTSSSNGLDSAATAAKGSGANDPSTRSGELSADEQSLLRKLLAARTLHCLGHLHRTGHLTQQEKTLLADQVITAMSAAVGARSVEGSAAQGCEEVQTAYALLVLGSRPDERLLRALAEAEAGAEEGTMMENERDGASTGGALRLPMDYDEVCEEDMRDFVGFCHNHANMLKERNNAS